MNTDLICADGWFKSIGRRLIGEMGQPRCRKTNTVGFAKTLETMLTAPPARQHTHKRKASAEISPPSDMIRTPSSGGSVSNAAPTHQGHPQPIISQAVQDINPPNYHRYLAEHTPSLAQGSSRLAIDAMLNPMPKHAQPYSIPSRVIVFDSGSRQASYTPPNLNHPELGSQRFSMDGAPRPGQGYAAFPEQYQLHQQYQQSYAAPFRGPPVLNPSFRSVAAPFMSTPASHYQNPSYQSFSNVPSIPRRISQTPNGSFPISSPSSNQDMRIAHGSSMSGAYPAQTASSSGVGKIDLGLSRMQAIMSAFPPLPVPAIHLAGTNGKGSVSAILESCLTAAGLRTARYNSPHLIEPRDAIRLDGLPPSSEDYNSTIYSIQAISDQYRVQATAFEIATAAAYQLINRFQPDIMIIECGMGGAEDATNVIADGMTLASALTSVGLDHTAFLGSDIASITEQKAKIAVPGGLFVVAPQTYPEAAAVARRVASQRGASVLDVVPSTEIPQERPGRICLRPFQVPPPTLVHTPLPFIIGHSNCPAPHLVTKLSLPGDHQLDNLSVALNILTTIRQDRRALTIQPKLASISDQALEMGVASARWPGRCAWAQWVDATTGQPFPILIDGAHNQDSARRLRQYIDSLVIEPRRPVTFIVSLSESKGKTVDSVLTLLLRPGDSMAAVDFSTPVEGMPWVLPVAKKAVRDVAAGMVGETGGLRVVEGSGPQAVEDAFGWATSDWDEKGPGLVVVCGSLYLVADVYRLLWS